MEHFKSNFLKTVDGKQIYYSTNFDHDNDKPIENILVFNYGLVCSNHHFKDQIKFFDECGFKILTHDYRGHYQSSGIDDINSINFENITNDLYQILNRLNIKNACLIGHSMGVNITLEFARKFPALVKSMVLISGTVMPVDNIMFDTNAMEYLKPIFMNILSKHPYMFKTFWQFAGWNPIVKKVIHVGGFNINQVSDEFIEIYLNRIARLSPELFFQLLDQMQKHHILAHLPAIKIPALVIGGDKDKVIPNYLQRLLFEQLENSEFYIVKNGSHVPQVDFPDFINKRINLFLTESCIR